MNSKSQPVRLVGNVKVNFDQAHERICKLVDTFEKNHASYFDSSYQESELRKDFLDKFFSALGWDVDHNHQTNPYEQEVKIEKRVKTGAAKRRADYSFSLAPRYQRPVFFVEAKKPQPNLATADNYFQAIRYSWNTQLPMVVLSDFASFHIIDARYRPSLHTALSRRHKVYDYRQYRDKALFSEIYWLFSREAIVSNSLANYAASLPSLAADALPTHQMGLFGGGYQSIDDLFLAQLDGYRETLARAFKRDNPELDGEQLTETVQRTLDRLVFLRFLEDKLIEPELVVQKIAAAKAPWKEFLGQSRRLDGIYNGIVFKQQSLLDKTDFLRTPQEFVDICAELSANDSPYDFNHVPVEILGRIYERFLGKVVKATAKRATVEEKPGVRKAGGVYYTPDYIVQYMAEQALAPLLKGKSPAAVLKTRVIDTSCGSGSFLIGVYSVLTQHLGKLFYNNPKLAKTGEWVESDGQWRLSLKKKRELLVQCIHGVDIDAQAVEVAQLSLYLKLMEDETTASAQQGQVEMQEALLPTLNRNIIVGNSLVSPLDDSGVVDFFADEQASAQYSALKAVNLRSSFHQVMEREGGFDLVIGNPPYIKEYTHREAFDGVRRSPYYQGKMDIWYLFACRGLDLLKPETGRLAFIATNNWVTNAGASRLRTKLLSDAVIEQLVDFGDYKVFRDAGIQTMILIARRASKPASYLFDLRRLEHKRATLDDAQTLLIAASTRAPGQLRLQARIDRTALAGRLFTFAASDSSDLLTKIDSARNFFLNERTEVAQGIVPNPDVLSKALFNKYSLREASSLGIAPGDGVFVVPSGHFRKTTQAEAKYLMPLLEPQDTKRYWVSETARLELIYAHKRWTDEVALPTRLLDHLRPYKRILDLRRETALGRMEWFNLHWPRDPRFFSKGERILAVRKCAEPTFAIVVSAVAVMMAFNIIKTERINLKYLTALLNSRLMRFWLRHKGKMQGKQFQVDKEPLLAMPLRTAEPATERRIITLVDQILRNMPLRDSATLDSRREIYQRDIDNADQQIQSLIYGTYRLTDDEVTHLEANS